MIYVTIFRCLAFSFRIAFKTFYLLITSTHIIVRSTIRLCGMLLLTIIFQSETYSQTLDVFFKVYTPKGDFRNVSISILKNKATALRFSPPTRRVKIKLDYDAEYLLKFELEKLHYEGNIR